MQPVAPLDVDALRAVRYEDAEALLTWWTRGALSALDLVVATEMPDAGDLTAILDAHAAFVQIEVFGGSERNPAQDVISVDVDVYVAGDADGNPNRSGAADLAELLRAAWLFNLPGYHTATATVSGVATMSRPSARPYDDNSTVRRIGAAYQVVLKSH